METLAKRLRRELERNLAASFGLNALTRGSQLVLTGLIIRNLGFREYGLWSILMAVVGSQTFIGLGIDGALQREFGRLRENTPLATVRQSYRGATAVYTTIACLAFALAAAAVVCGFLRDIAPSRPSQLAIAMSCAAAFAASNQTSLETGALIGLGRFRLNAILQVAASIALLAGFLVDSQVRSNLTPALAWFALLKIMQLAATRIAVKFVIRALPTGNEHPETLTRRQLLARFATLSTAFQVSAVADYVFFLVPRFILAAAIGLRGVALFDVGLKLGQLVSVPATLVLPGLVPALAAARADTRIVNTIYWSVTRILLFLAAVGTSISVTSAGWLSDHLTGTQLSFANLVGIRWVMVAIIAQTLSGPALELAAVYDDAIVIAAFKLIMVAGAAAILSFSGILGLVDASILLTVCFLIGGSSLLILVPRRVGLLFGRAVIQRTVLPAAVVLIVGGLLAASESFASGPSPLIAGIFSIGASTAAALCFRLHREYSYIGDAQTIVGCNSARSN